MDSAATSSNGNFLRELECPVCYEYMEPPIGMCETGHPICVKCKPQLKNCPVCRKNITGTRNIPLENIAGLLVYPCKYKDVGCPEILSLKEKLRHQSECMYETRKCPFSMDCPWEGCIVDIKSHVKNDHKQGYDAGEVSGEFEVVISDFSGGKFYRGHVFTLNELFFIMCDVKNGNFLFSIVHVGLKKNVPNFRYRFALGTNKNEMNVISMIFGVRNFMDDEEFVLNLGDCVSLHFITVVKYLDENNRLYFKIEIVPSDWDQILLHKTGEEISHSHTITLYEWTSSCASDSRQSNPIHVHLNTGRFSLSLRNPVRHPIPNLGTRLLAQHYDPASHLFGQRM
ncbi:E3 ubiquitin-protein ligase Siah1-like [Periplaneta americana]|uniref:E3 ubiquitin-protein ligase Siah1-like n=1 Tax=Periplaneta americana TaxID=6978 RepID=UPI0037E89C19